jgi:hypothetical protein
VSRRQFKRGGKVHGEAAMAHAGRKPRKSGGSTLTANSLINRNVKEANEERVGTKHIGGMKKGGRTHKMIGGGCEQMPARPMPGMRPMMRKAGGKAKCGGGMVAKAKGGSVEDGALEGTRPAGGRLARKGGGRAKKGMNVNIIIAPSSPKPAMPLPGGLPPPGGGPVGLHQGAPPPPPMMPPPGAAPPMGPAPMPRKSGGRATNVHDQNGRKVGRAYPIESGAGGGLGRLEKIRAYGWRVLTGNTQFEHELKKRIAEETERVTGILTTGLAVKDYAEYKYHLGQLHALAHVVDAYCDEVNTTISKQR